MALMAPAIASEASESFRYGLKGNNIVFTSKQDALIGRSFELAIRDGKPARILLELVDIYAEPGGSKRAIPLGSSPYSPAGLVVLPEIPEYIPNGDFQYFDIPIRFDPAFEGNRPVLGGLEISLLSQASDSGSIRLESSIVATFAYYPLGLLEQAQYQPGLEIRAVKVLKPKRDPFPLSLLPDLPFVFNGGELQVDYQLENIGEIFLETQTLIKLKQLGPLVSDTDRISYQSEPIAVFLVPGQITDGQLPLHNGPDAPQGTQQLGFGFFEVSLEAAGSLGDELNVRAIGNQTIFIFPWKQLVLVILVLFLFRKRIRKVIRSLIEYRRAFREFRKSQTKVDAGANPEQE